MACTKVAVVALFTAMLMSPVLGYSYHVANAQGFSKTLLNVKMIYVTHQYTSNPMRSSHLKCIVVDFLNFAILQVFQVLVIHSIYLHICLLCLRIV